ncbi:30S ribosomal protein S3 [bacterium (Candidatus Gribaldobacteria) CG_4_10_14_0_8_um_filter_33_9]|uniref:Small ribosomal subunit protein uS3 n=1 Tax=bacterium (Candidatus Gribaldobacteria) CG_4_10_14_0_8_um_filter_33_9 TaxID=2014266 RepID=A0A2M7RN54_9BACT|nr:MAG: 30S ribosomal protein S3 [bacterium (Candidatus Gribaldobacteria) CG_4_10_14_0_8_um_filter_33_9]
MSHITNPKILRIRKTEDWMSRGFYKKNFPLYLEEDFKIRNFLLKNLPKGTIEGIEIERGSTFLKIFIKTARPALIIGRGGKEVKKIKKEIEKIITPLIKGKESIKKQEVKIEILTVKDPWASASLASQWVALQLEKRARFRQVLKMVLSKIMFSREVKGARVQVAGRLNGVSISRTEWLQQGELSRQTIRAVIDYGFSTALCSYGIIGVKVWIYKGQKLE